MLNRLISRRSKLEILGLIVIVVIGTIPLLLICPGESNTQKHSRGHSEPVTIVPGLRVGDYTLGMSKYEGFKFEIHEKKRTIVEITVRKKISGGHGDSLVKPIKSVKKSDGVRSKDLRKLALSFGKGFTATLEFNESSLKHPLYLSHDRI